MQERKAAAWEAEKMKMRLGPLDKYVWEGRNHRLEMNPDLYGSLIGGESQRSVMIAEGSKNLLLMRI